MRLMKLIVGMLAIASSLCAYSIEKTYKATVAGGFLNGGKTSITGLAPGDKVSVGVDWGKLSETVEFGGWSYTPAGANLGESFNQLEPWTTATMPSADVKFTANYVIGFAACLGVECEMVGEADPGDLYWSVDNGKMLIPIDREFPGKAGKVTVKFYDKTGNWRASDVVLSIDKRGTYKEDGVTYYEPAKEIFVHAKFVPSASSTKVKLDSNGGNVTREEFFAHGCEYGNLGIPYRKGYVFAGWWTAKNGGEYIARSKIFDPADFAGQRTPTLYAHWIATYALTVKGEGAYAEWDWSDEQYESLPQEVFEGEYDCEVDDNGVVNVPAGAIVNVSASSYAEDRRGNELVFMKWDVSPAKTDLGAEFQVGDPDTALVMPSGKLTLTATYIDESTCGRVYASTYASSVELGYDYETGEEITIEPPYAAFEWSPDGGKTWYKTGYWDNNGYWDDDYGWVDGEDYWVDNGSVLLKKGAYTVTWRSTDPRWSVQYQYPTTKITVVEDGYADVYAQFVYVPQVVVDVMTYENGECKLSTAGGTATMNPKNGLVPLGKSITFTAKASKDYVFQGWQFAMHWQYGDYFLESSATWKVDNRFVYAFGSYMSQMPLFNMYIDPSDFKVHVVAVFKALSEYSADDIAFNEFSTANGAYPVSDNSVTVRAVVGCAVEYSLYSEPAAYPLTYKLAGKLPDGLKFDAKTGVLTGVPKKAGKATVSIVASDPAKNSRALTVVIDVMDIPQWLAGEYRGALYNKLWVSGYWEEDDQTGESYYVDGEYVPGLQNGILELTVKSDGKVSAKVLTRYGSRSVSGTLEWRDPEAAYDYIEDERTEFSFWHTDKDDAWCHVNFSADGTIAGQADSYDKKEDEYAGGELEGLRQDKDLFADSSFLNKYYTSAFCQEQTEEVYDPYEYEWVESEMRSGYGYLTIKTDKNGAAKVTGQLPDGEKVSMSALLMPFACETTEEIGARLYLFASPSAYKKLGWFAMMMTLNPDGSVSFENNSCWTANGEYGEDAAMYGDGALYSEAKPLEDYYWMVSCACSDSMVIQYSYKGMSEDEDTGKPYSWTGYDYAYAQDFEGCLFNVSVKGDSKGAISLVNKSPAPWKDGDEWNYWEDKNGNEITDPSQLSISFAKATGIFTGKANAYFDYELPSCKQNSQTKEIEWSYAMQHVTAVLPYSGVMIDDGEGGYVGLGAAVHTYKYSYTDDYGKTKSDTKKVSLPVSLDPVQ